MTAERNKIQILLKWEDVPSEGNHHIEKVEWIKTKKGGMTMALVNQHGEQPKALSSSYGWKESSLGDGEGGLGWGLTDGKEGLVHVNSTEEAWVEGSPKEKRSTQPSSAWNNLSIHTLSQELSIWQWPFCYTPPFSLAT